MTIPAIPPGAPGVQFTKNNSIITGLSQGLTTFPLNASKIAAMTSYTSKPIMGFAGDSICNYAGGPNSNSVIGYILSRLYPCDIKYGGQSGAPINYNFAVSGASTSQIVSVQLPLIVANPPDFLVLNGGTNDFPTTLAAANTVIANLKAMITGSFAAGVSAIIMMPITPRSDGLANASCVQPYNYVNHVMQNYCSSTQGCYWLNILPAFIDPTSSTFGVIGGSAGSALSPTYDLLHPSTYGATQIAPFFLPILQNIARPRKARAINLSDVYSATLNPGGNRCGTAGNFAGTGGVFNGSFNTSVATGWWATSANGIVVTPSIVTSSYLPGGYRAQRFDFSGVASAAGTFLTFYLSAINSVDCTALPKFDAEGIIRIAATGISQAVFSFSINGGAISQFGSLGTSVSTAYAALPCNDIQQGGDYFMFCALSNPIQSYADNTQLNISCNFAARSGQVVSGFVEISNFGIFSE